LAAMSRADVPMHVLQGLPNFYFYVDEFQNFANESFSDILSEARKYKLNLIIAHQYVEQMEEEVRDAVFGNVGTTVSFRVGPFDAETLETIFNPQFTATDLVNLGFAQIYLTLMIDGVGSPPFSATTLPPFDPPPETFVRQVLEMSRMQFGKPRMQVEEAIKKWHEADPQPVAEAKPKRTYTSNSTPRPARSSVPTTPSVSTRGELDTNMLGERLEHRPASQQQRPRAQAPLGRARPAGEARRAEGDRPNPNPRPDRPPLGGAHSLREALMQATGKKVESEPAPPAPKAAASKTHSNLKDTLRKIAPAADVPTAQPTKKGPPLHNDELASMLAVDEIPDVE